MAMAMIVILFEARMSRLEERAATLSDLLLAMQNRPASARRVPLRHAPAPARTDAAPPAAAPVEEADPSECDAPVEAPAPAEAASAATPPADRAAPRRASASNPPETAGDQRRHNATLVHDSDGAQGRILVCQPQRQRILIDVGRSAGIQPNARFTLWRDGVCLGEARVERSFADMSLCRLVAPMPGLRVGDPVREVSTEMALMDMQEMVQDKRIPE
jgi:hypothetical protein